MSCILDLISCYFEKYSAYFYYGEIFFAARYQAAVSAFVGGLVAVGGTDAWNCLSSVEIYNPQTDTWTLTAPLGTPRRGAGIDVVDSKETL